MSIRISAVVCTHNRAAYLRKAVRSLVEQTLRRDLYEIIVVDNGSKDETRQVVEEFSDVPNLRYLYEPVLGLSRARNTGWSEANGEYVAYLDDDAVASPTWLGCILDTFESFKPVPGAVGGHCDPVWEAPRPDWLGNNMLSALSVFNWADTTAKLNERQWLSGCNVAFQRDLLERIGGFSEALGRRGNQLLSNEENYTQQQLRKLGFALVYNPQIAVQHHISAGRLTKEWFKRARYGQGVSEALMVEESARLSAPARVWLTLRALLWGFPRAALMLTERTEAGRFRRQCQTLEVAGYAVGLWQLRSAYEHWTAGSEQVVVDTQPISVSSQPATRWRR